MKIVWTRTAQRRFRDILDYIEQEFGDIHREHFKTKTSEFTILLKEFPQIGMVEVRDKDLRGFQLTKQTRVFYRITRDSVIILTFFDSRQDPGKKPR